LEKSNALDDTIFGDKGIRIEEQDVFSLCLGNGLVIRGSKSFVFIVKDELYSWKTPLKKLSAAVGGMIIDYNYFTIQVL